MYTVMLLAVSLNHLKQKQCLQNIYMLITYGAFDVSALESPPTYGLSTSVAPHSNLSQYE